MKIRLKENIRLQYITPDLDEKYCQVHIKQSAFTFDKEKNDRARIEWRAYENHRDRREREHEEALKKAVANNDINMLQKLCREQFQEPFPDNLTDMVCGAKTRTGTPCKRTELHRNGRCRFHGGLSTGPKTTKGKRKVALNLPS